MDSPLKEFCELMQKCLGRIEKDIKISVQEAINAIQADNEHAIVLDKTKDYHYQEILTHLMEIRKHIEQIGIHDYRLNNLNQKLRPKTKSLDKDYVKRQVEVFQSHSRANSNQQSEVHRRDSKKHERFSQVESMRHLENWEHYLENHEEIEAKLNKFNKDDIKKRTNSKESLRKTKKFVSSTHESFLDTFGNEDLETVQEEEDKAETVNPTIEDEIDFKPRVIGVTLKKEL